MSDVVFSGTVTRGTQLASGGAVGRPNAPFPDSTLSLQQPYFRERGIELDALVPHRVLGTVNVEVPYTLTLNRAGFTVPLLDWTQKLDLPARIAPETFSFAPCVLIFEGREYAGFIYYPHPETKPDTNGHRYDVIEVIAPRIEGLAYDMPIAVRCDALLFNVDPKLREVSGQPAE